MLHMPIVKPTIELCMLTTHLLTKYTHTHTHAHALHTTPETYRGE